jgi:hypothetical protein
VRLDAPLAPDTRYLIEVKGVSTLSGVSGDARRPLLTPKADTTPAPRRP